MPATEQIPRGRNADMFASLFIFLLQTSQVSLTLTFL